MIGGYVVQNTNQLRKEQLQFSVVLNPWRKVVRSTFARSPLCAVLKNSLLVFAIPSRGAPKFKIQQGNNTTFHRTLVQFQRFRPFVYLGHYLTCNITMKKLKEFLVFLNFKQRKGRGLCLFEEEYEEILFISFITLRSISMMCLRR